MMSASNAPAAPGNPGHRQPEEASTPPQSVGLTLEDCRWITDNLDVPADDIGRLDDAPSRAAKALLPYAQSDASILRNVLDRVLPKKQVQEEPDKPEEMLDLTHIEDSLKAEFGDLAQCILFATAHPEVVPKWLGDCGAASAPQG